MMAGFALLGFITPALHHLLKIIIDPAVKDLHVIEIFIG